MKIFKETIIMAFDLNKFIDALTSSITEGHCDNNNGTTVYFNSSVSDINDAHEMSKTLKEELNDLCEKLRSKIDEEKIREFDENIKYVSQHLGDFLSSFSSPIDKNEEKKEQECDSKECNCNNSNNCAENGFKHLKKNALKKDYFKNKNNAEYIAKKQSIAERLREELSKQPTADELTADSMVAVIVKKLQTPNAYTLHAKSEIAEACAEIKAKYSDFKDVTYNKLMQDSFVLSSFKEKLIKETGANDVYLSLNDDEYLTVYITI